MLTINSGRRTGTVRVAGAEADEYSTGQSGFNNELINRIIMVV